MKQAEQAIEIESIPIGDVAEELRHTRPFADADVSNLGGVDRVDRVHAKAGSRASGAGTAHPLLLAGA